MPTTPSSSPTHRPAAVLPSVSASAADAPPCSSPYGWWVRASTGIVARMKSAPNSVKTMPSGSISVLRDRAFNCSRVVWRRNIILAGTGIRVSSLTRRRGSAHREAGRCPIAGVTGTLHITAAAAVTGAERGGFLAFVGGGVGVGRLRVGSADGLGGHGVDVHGELLGVMLFRCVGKVQHQIYFGPCQKSHNWSHASNH